MLNNDDISLGPNNDNTEDDLELDDILDSYQTKFKRPQSSEKFISTFYLIAENPNDQSKLNETRSLGRRIEMPREFQKAKRTCNKIVNDYFN